MAVRFNGKAVMIHAKHDPETRVFQAQTHAAGAAEQVGCERHFMGPQLTAQCDEFFLRRSVAWMFRQLHERASDLFHRIVWCRDFRHLLTHAARLK